MPGFGDFTQDAFAQTRSINRLPSISVTEQFVATSGVFQLSGALRAPLDMKFKISHPRRIEFARKVERHGKLCFATVHQSLRFIRLSLRWLLTALAPKNERASFAILLVPG